jgi:hypothetical protein
MVYKGWKGVFMKKIKEIGVKMVFLATFFSSAFGCVVTIKNDSQGKVLIVDNNVDATEAMEISKGKRKKWGTEHERLHVTIFMKEPRARIYTAQYEIVQKQCAAGKEHLELSISAIKSGDMDKELKKMFEITNYQASSTAQESCCSTK